MKRRYKLTEFAITGLMAVTLGLISSPPARAAPLDLGDVPLFIDLDTEPNVVLSMDDSGSMRRCFILDGNVSETNVNSGLVVFPGGASSAIDDRPHHSSVDFEGDVDRDIWSNALTWNYYGEDVQFTSISSYVDWDISEQSDFDFTEFDSVRRFTDESEEYFYQELRLSSG